VDVTYFNADLTNEIDVAGFPQKPFNEVGKSMREGVEVAARTDLGSGLSLGAAYTYLNGESRTVPRPYAGRPTPAAST
jgi:outer membrane cobalamin receptor